MIAIVCVVLLLVLNDIAFLYVLRQRESALDDRWQARLQKCDAIQALAERAEQRTHEGLVEIARAHDRTQDHLLAMERITTDPRVVQALR